MRGLGALVACGLVWSCSRALPEIPPALTGVASVIDGDTIEIHGQRIRLSGFDTPESGKRCGSVNVYHQASLALSNFVGTRTVRCIDSGERDRDRVVATCSIGGVDLGDHIVSQGWGRDWPRYSNRKYADEEAAARTTKRGLWGLSCPANLWGDRKYN
jgi:endonuclease YncB( thermonuclease family)